MRTLLLLLSFSVILLFGSCVEQEIVGIPPNSYELKQNLPNPFTDTTVIEYGIPSVGTIPPRIRISVYNRYHDRIEVLRDSINHPAGNFSITWKPYDSYPSGLYYIELQRITDLLAANQILKRIATIKQ